MYMSVSPCVSSFTSYLSRVDLSASVPFPLLLTWVCLHTNAPSSLLYSPILFLPLHSSSILCLTNVVSYLHLRVFIRVIFLRACLHVSISFHELVYMRVFFQLLPSTSMFTYESPFNFTSTWAYLYANVPSTSIFWCECSLPPLYLHKYVYIRMSLPPPILIPILPLTLS